MRPAFTAGSVGTGGPSSAHPLRGVRASDAPGRCRPSVAHLGAGLLLSAVLLLAGTAGAQEGVFLTEDQAPAAVFPEAKRFQRAEIEATPELRERMRRHLNGTTPSLWEERYVVFHAFDGERLLGDAFLVEEIGKHRPISFVVGLRPDRTVEDVAVMAYREAFGGEIRTRRFLAQYHGKGSADPLRTYHEVMNVAGATLSVDAASRAVKKAQALSAALGTP